jgi:chaperone modulatory protein CbpM
MELRESSHRRHDLDSEVLDRWVDSGWLIPHDDLAGRGFSGVDLARAQLIRDLQNLGVNDHSVPIILDLIDQLHGVRNVLRQMLLTAKAARQERDGA